MMPERSKSVAIITDLRLKRSIKTPLASANNWGTVMAAAMTTTARPVFSASSLISTKAATTAKLSPTLEMSWLSHRAEKSRFFKTVSIPVLPLFIRNPLSERSERGQL
jgi:hypothetical protein